MAKLSLLSRCPSYHNIMTSLTVAFCEQVGLMQDELRVLQPQLIETSEITEKLMVKIEQDTVVVEAKKEVSLLLCMTVDV